MYYHIIVSISRVYFLKDCARNNNYFVVNKQIYVLTYTSIYTYTQYIYLNENSIGVYGYNGERVRACVHRMLLQCQNAGVATSVGRVYASTFCFQVFKTTKIVKLGM